MLLDNCFHTDENNHDHVPYSSKGFPYACIQTDLEQHADRCIPWHWHTSMEIVNVVIGTMDMISAVLKAVELMRDEPEGYELDTI